MSDDWNRCCDIIERLEEIGDEHILADCVRMCCANSDEIMNCVIGQYGEVLNRDEYWID